MSKLIGEIILFSGTIIPQGFMPCDGRTLETGKWQALYTVIGNTYGGDQRHFALPDLRARAPIGLNIADRSDGRTPSLLGRSGGAETAKTKVALTEENLPPHSHAITGQVAVGIQVASDNGNATTGKDAYLAQIPDPSDPLNNPPLNAYLPTTNNPKPTIAGNLGGVSSSHTLKIGSAGQAKPLEVAIPRDPFLTIRYLIAVGGDVEYPIRDEDLKDE